MARGIIFDIKRYAIHDGPGIRTTVFLKGCSLRCQWCHNPEGIKSKPEISLRSTRCAKECSECVSVCPQDAISKDGNFIEIDQDKCDLCGVCDDVCVYEALEIVGREVTVEEVMDEIEKDGIFFDESGGGITFSGGEPLMQIDFLETLLKEIKKKNIHVTLDTSGYVSFEDLERVSPNVDLFLYDIKIMDKEKHEKYTGVSNKLILENLRKLSEIGKPVAVRIPLVSGINDDDQNIQMLAEYLHGLKNIKQINLLAYHRGGCEKYKRLRKEKIAKTFSPPSDERIEEIKKILTRSGFSVKKGG
ncbi:MAG TPA: glycyl-radical enzyme activating protein [Candidatus Aminicenantes bacterium]|nr:glycyl-radical enzyme activating protein [Candidatus Aminicenantes bacterium]